MWDKNIPYKPEVKKCRRRVISFCQGLGLDIGCGEEKISPNAIGIDVNPKADIKIDLSQPNALSIFTDGSFDYVFSSHCLEDFYNTEEVLKEWWRVIKVGGYLILYGPDPDFYPRVGEKGANPNHKKDMYWQDVWKIIKKFGNAKLISASRHNEDDEYSWQLIIQKVNMKIKNKLFQLKKKFKGQIAFPRVKKENKTCLISRYGALGDVIQSTVILPVIKQDGYKITFNTTPRLADVLKYNPYIDEFLLQEEGSILDTDLDGYWETISKDYDKFVNLHGVVEGGLLKVEGSEEYFWPDKKRREKCNKNYFDALLERAGYLNIKGRLPELYFSDDEEKYANLFRLKFFDKFLVIWALAGSSFHKVYPWTEHTAVEFMRRHKDAIIITVGDEMCKMLEWTHPQTINKAGIWDIRQSFIMTKYVDLVIGPETGVLNAAGCFDTPKICLLTHSSKQNLTKYWKNDYSIQSPVECSPCHRLIYSKDGSGVCQQSIKTNSPICMERIQPETIINKTEKVYELWKQRGGKR